MIETWKEYIVLICKRARRWEQLGCAGKSTSVTETANSSLRNKEGIGSRLSVINCPKSPAGYGGRSHTIFSETITQIMENQRLDKLS